MMIARRILFIIFAMGLYTEISVAQSVKSFGRQLWSHVKPALGYGLMGATGAQASEYFGLSPVAGGLAGIGLYYAISGLYNQYRSSVQHYSDLMRDFFEQKGQKKSDAASKLIDILLLYQGSLNKDIAIQGMQEYLRSKRYITSYSNSLTGKGFDAFKSVYEYKFKYLYEQFAGSGVIKLNGFEVAWQLLLQTGWLSASKDTLSEQETYPFSRMQSIRPNHVPFRISRFYGRARGQMLEEARKEAATYQNRSVDDIIELILLARAGKENDKMCTILVASLIALTQKSIDFPVFYSLLLAKYGDDFLRKETILEKLKQHLSICIDSDIGDNMDPPLKKFIMDIFNYLPSVNHRMGRF